VDIRVLLSLLQALITALMHGNQAAATHAALPGDHAATVEKIAAHAEAIQQHLDAIGKGLPPQS
jgi:hypothetical protein